VLPFLFIPQVIHENGKIIIGITYITKGQIKNGGYTVIFPQEILRPVITMDQADPAGFRLIIF
jgi:hypothetical protein